VLLLPPELPLELPPELLPELSPVPPLEVPLEPPDEPPVSPLDEPPVLLDVPVLPFPLLLLPVLPVEALLPLFPLFPPVVGGLGFDPCGEVPCRNTKGTATATCPATMSAAMPSFFLPDRIILVFLSPFCFVAGFRVGVYYSTN